MGSHPFKKLRAREARPDVQKRYMRVAGALFIIAWAPTMVLLFFNLLAMQVARSAGILIIVFGALATFTNLLFNRARSHEDGPLRRRTLVAAEIALRATILFAVAAAVAGAWYAYMLSAGYKPLKLDWAAKEFVGVVPEYRLIPLLLATALTIILYMVTVLLHHSVEILARRSLGFSTFPDVYKPARRKIRAAMNKTKLKSSA